MKAEHADLGRAGGFTVTLAARVGESVPPDSALVAPAIASAAPDFDFVSTAVQSGVTGNESGVADIKSDRTDITSVASGI
jgi:hypothetical protein